MTLELGPESSQGESQVSNRGTGSISGYSSSTSGGAVVDACAKCWGSAWLQSVSTGKISEITSGRQSAAAAAAKLLQSCPTLCDPIDGSPPGSPIPGILQARTLEWVAISFSNARKWKVKVKSLSRIWLLATPWTGAYQAPASMGFSRQEYWSGVPLPSPTQPGVQTN